VGVPAEDLKAVFAAGELPGEVGDDDVELGGDRGEIGGGECAFAALILKVVEVSRSK
jgi:hypothetical protein